MKLPELLYLCMGRKMRGKRVQEVLVHKEVEEMKVSPGKM